MKKRQWIVIVLLALTAGAVWRFSLTEVRSGDKKLYARTIPRNLGKWGGVDRPVAKEVTDVLRTTDVLERHYYATGGEYAVFSVVFAMDDRRAVHTPQECMVGGGNQIVSEEVLTYPAALPVAGVEPDPETGEIPLDIALAETIDLSVIELRMAGPNGHTMVHFFYKSGSDVTHSYVRHEIDMLLSNLRRGSSTNSLVKVTTSVDPPFGREQQQEARERCQELMTLLFPYVMLALP